MDMRIVLAVAHYANLVMDCISVIMFFQVMFNECVDDFFLGSNIEFIRQGKFNFPVAGAIGPFVLISSSKKGLRVIACPFRQMMCGIDTASLGSE